MKIGLACLALTVLVLPACGGDDDGAASGTLSVTVYGEEFIEEGIPADAFVDGWAIDFDRFLVSIGEVTAAVGEDDPSLSDDSYRIFDLAQSSGGEGFEVASGEVDGGGYDHVGFRIAPGTDPAAGNASADDVTLMADGGYALYVEGTATREEEEKTFAWGFAGATRYGHCEGTAEVDGDTASTQITVHADHLFYDDLVSSEPNVAFDLVAAADDVGDADGDVTQDELAAVDITSEERYQVGNNTEVTDLWAFIDFQVSTVGHIDGEGHCEEAVRE
jgi:hypothetical protein